MTRIDPQQLTAAESRLFPETPTGLVFAVDAAAARLQIATVPRKPTYTGEINVDVVADGKTLTETYTLRCSSPSARVERVLLFCSHAQADAVAFQPGWGQQRPNRGPAIASRRSRRQPGYRRPARPGS